jgi:hypothetical protein
LGRRLSKGRWESRRFDGTGQPSAFARSANEFDFHHEPFDNIAVPEEVKKRFEPLTTIVYLADFARADDERAVREKPIEYNHDKSTIRTISQSCHN